MSGITLQNSQVNGGTTVDLPDSTTATYAWNNITDAAPIATKYDITEVDYAGFSNPIMTVQGTIDINDTTSNRLTLALLMDFATIKTTSTLTVSAGTTPSYLGGRPSGGYSTTGGNTMTNNITVRVKSFKITFSGPTSEKGHTWDFNITFVETT